MTRPLYDAKITLQEVHDQPSGNPSVVVKFPVGAKVNCGKCFAHPTNRANMDAGLNCLRPPLTAETTGLTINLSSVELEVDAAQAHVVVPENLEQLPKRMQETLMLSIGSHLRRFLPCRKVY